MQAWGPINDILICVYIAFPVRRADSVSGRLGNRSRIEEWTLPHHVHRVHYCGISWRVELAGLGTRLPSLVWRGGASSMGG